MKKILFSFMVVCAFQMIYAQTGNEEFWRIIQHIDDVQKAYISNNNEISSNSSQQQKDYVDLGLPSGTLWKDQNESGGFYTYDQAMAKFGNSLPTKKQLEELKDACRWTWNGNGYKVEGPSGESIVLPASGYRNCGGSVRLVGSDGVYWSSTPNGSENTWDLYFDSGEVGMANGIDRCLGLSVRLVR